MEPQEVVQAFMDAYNAGDLDTAASYLADDVQISGPTPEPIGAAEFLGLRTMLGPAFPDIEFHMRIESVEGNVVKAANSWTGTHTGDLDLSAGVWASSQPQASLYRFLKMWESGPSRVAKSSRALGDYRKVVA